MRPYISFALTAAVVSGCNLYNGRCTYELRGYTGQGDGVDNGTVLASGQVTLSEQRGSIVRQSFSWLVTGGIKGHVTSASFKNSTNPSTVLLNLPVLGADRDPILEGAADSNAGDPLGGFHDILVAQHGEIELQTDLPATPVVVIPIATVNAGDWIRPYCS